MSHRVISTILRRDSRQTSYKIALLRALNDVVLAYPDVGRDGRDVAVPLRSLAEAWVACYWPFVAPEAPIWQGVRSLLGEKQRQDVGFRAHLAELRRGWEAIYGPSGAAGGWHLIEHLRVARKRVGYAAALLKRRPRRCPARVPTTSVCCARRSVGGLPRCVAVGGGAVHP